MRFVIEIELGNDAMQTPGDVADCVQNALDDLQSMDASGQASFIEGQSEDLFDTNGNRVGEWKIDTRPRREEQQRRVQEEAKTNPTTNLEESLASYAHEAWTGWMRYLFKVSTQNDDGSVTIPPEQVGRWKGQMATHYTLLKESEKESDRLQARQILTIIDAEKR